MDNKDYEQWLDSLQPGDEVCHYSRWHGYRITRIIKITPTRQMKTEDGYVFRGGYDRTGSEWVHIQPVTHEIKQGIWRKNAISTVRNLEFSELTDDQLKSILDIAQGGVSHG
jgi:hypothetical protein